MNLRFFIPIFVTATLVSCGNQPKPGESFSVEEENVIDTTMVDTMDVTIRDLNLSSTPYTSIEEIIAELSTIKALWESDFDNHYFGDSLFFDRMKFHLSNPVTFREWKATSEYNPLKVSVTPDGKYKFYTTWDVSDGTMGHWVTYYQYLDPKGKLVCREWQADRRFDCQGNVVGVWQFKLHDTMFYVLKSVWKGSSCEWGYNMEIATFDGGRPTYHIRFFPDMKEYNEIKKLSYANGDWEESDWVKEDGSYCVSYTCRALDVDYTFNPKTLTVTATTQADTGDVVKTERWKLKT